MSVYKRERSPYYHYDFWRDGERHRGSTGCTDRREAAAKVRQLIREVEAAGKQQQAAGSALTLAEAAARYFTEVCEHGASPRADLALLDNLSHLIGPSLDIRRLTDSELAAAVAKRRKQFRMDNPKLGLVSASTVTQLLRRWSMPTVQGETRVQQ